jgi:hypothetical protein
LIRRSTFSGWRHPRIVHVTTIGDDADDNAVLVDRL